MDVVLLMFHTVIVIFGTSDGNITENWTIHSYETASNPTNTLRTEGTAKAAVSLPQETHDGAQRLLFHDSGNYHAFISNLHTSIILSSLVPGNQTLLQPSDDGGQIAFMYVNDSGGNLVPIRRQWIGSRFMLSGPTSNSTAAPALGPITTGPNCKPGKTGPTIGNFILIGYARIVLDAKSYEECYGYCLNAQTLYGFQCKSGMIYASWQGTVQNCILNSEMDTTELNAPSVLQSSVDYFETDCAIRSSWVPRKKSNEEALKDLPTVGNWTLWSPCGETSKSYRYQICRKSDVRECEHEQKDCSYGPAPGPSSGPVAPAVPSSPSAAGPAVAPSLGTETTGNVTNTHRNYGAGYGPATIPTLETVSSTTVATVESPAPSLASTLASILSPASVSSLIVRPGSSPDSALRPARGPAAESAAGPFNVPTLTYLNSLKQRNGRDSVPRFYMALTNICQTDKSFKN